MNAPAHGYSLDFIQSMLSEKSGRMAGWFNDLELRSVFQPTFSLPHKRAIGFEASLRAADTRGKPVSPQELFGPIQNFAETSMLDMLCMTLHVHNFFMPNAPRGLLLLNLHPDVLLDFSRNTDFFSALFRHYRLPPGKLMIDIPESILEHPALGDAIKAYRQLGFLISVDDFGVENTNLDTIWHTTPTMVKIDRSVIDRAVTDRHMRQILPRAVSLLHEMGTLVLMEGIESEAEALIALDTDADFGSGFFLGPMHESLSDFTDTTEQIKGLWRLLKDLPPPAVPAETTARATLESSPLHSSNIKKFRHASTEEIGRYRQDRRPFLNELQNLASKVQAGAPLETACDEFLVLPGAIRCYALNGDGSQLGPATMAPNPPAREGTDFQHLSGQPGGNWSRRDFFRRAVKEPGVVQVTRQYCSLLGYPRCVTFSIVVPVAGKPMIICGDVDWTSHAMARLPQR